MFNVIFYLVFLDFEILSVWSLKLYFPEIISPDSFLVDESEDLPSNVSLRRRERPPDLEGREDQWGGGPRTEIRKTHIQ